MKHKRFAIGFLVFLLAISILLVLVYPMASVYTTLPQTPNGGFQLALLIWVSSLMTLLIGLISGYVIVPFYLAIHKIINHRRSSYGIQDILIDDNTKQPNRFLQGVYPALISVNLAIFLAPYFMDVILIEAASEWAVENNYFLAMIGLMMFTSGPALGIFVAAWMLNDSGVGYTNSINAKERGEFVERRSIGGWFLQFLKGYSGISVIISFFQVISGWMAISAEPLHQIWLTIILVFLLPIIITGCLNVFLFDISSRKRRTGYVLWFAKKMGIRNQL